MVGQEKRIQLEEGFDLMTQRLPHIHTVSADLGVDASSFCEPAEQTGITCLIEQLLFRGRHRYCNNHPFTSQIDLLGGKRWVATYKAFLSYWLFIPCDVLRQRPLVVFEMVQYPLFAPENIKYKKQPVAHEAAEISGNGMPQAQMVIDQAMWPHHVLERPLLGTQTILELFRREDIQMFCAQHYTRNPMVAAIRGNVDLEEIDALLKWSWNDRELRGQAPLQQTPDAIPSTSFPHQHLDEGCLHILF